MPDPMLQDPNCVAVLQHPVSYNATMSLRPSRQVDGPLASRRRVADLVGAEPAVGAVHAARRSSWIGRSGRSAGGRHQPSTSTGHPPGGPRDVVRRGPRRIPLLVAVIVPVLGVAPVGVHHTSKSIGVPGLPNVLLLVIVIVIVGVVRARLRSRHAKNLPGRPDQWPPRNLEGRPGDRKDDPRPWQ